MTPRMVAALYVDRLGPYPKMQNVDCWDESRNAKLYDGPYPVVAHPPCGPWSKLRHLCTKQDASCGPRAVEQVNKFGGVLEHPAHSLLWRECWLPAPDSDDMGLAFARRFTLSVNQVSWGHSCAKPTWLYCVGISWRVLVDGIRTGGIATHCVCTGPRQRQRLPVATKKAKRLTPPAFAEWLVSLARASEVSP